MHAQLSKKASNDMMEELQESLAKLQEMSAETKEKQEKDVKRLNTELVERIARADGQMQDLEGRLKVVEDELNEDDPAEGADRVESGLDRREPLGGAFSGAVEADVNLGEVQGDDEGVNIGETKSLAAGVTIGGMKSEVQLAHKVSEPAASTGPANQGPQSSLDKGASGGLPGQQQ